MKSSRLLIMTCTFAIVLFAGCQTVTSPSASPTDTATPSVTASPKTTESDTPIPTPLGIEVTSSPIVSPETTAETTTGLSLAAEGEFCGGIAGISCEEGLICQYEGDYPDAGGTCIKWFNDIPEGSPYYVR